METENTSEVDDNDKCLNGKELHEDKGVNLNVYFGDIDQSEDYVTDLKAEIDLDDNVDVAICEIGKNMDNSHFIDDIENSKKDIENQCDEPVNEENCSTETNELSENGNELDIIDEENLQNTSKSHQNTSELKDNDSLVDKRVDTLNNDPEKIDQVSNTEMGNKLEGDDISIDNIEDSNIEKNSDEKDFYQIPQNEIQTLDGNVEAVLENEPATSDSKDLENFKTNVEGELGTDVDHISFSEVKGDEHYKESADNNYFTVDTNKLDDIDNLKEDIETKEIADDTKFGTENDIDIQSDIDINNEKVQTEPENSVYVDTVTLNENIDDLKSFEIDSDSIDKEGIQQFLKAVIDDLQGIVIDTEECDTAVEEINSKFDESSVEIEVEKPTASKTEKLEDDIIVEVKVENSTFNETVEHEDESIKDKETEEKLDELELIIDTNDSDDSELINEVKACELMIEERSDETIQCNNGSETETKDVNEFEIMTDSKDDSARSSSMESVEKSTDEETLIKPETDTTNHDLSNDKNENDFSEIDKDNKTELGVSEELNNKNAPTTAEEIASVKNKETTEAMVSKDQELKDLKSSLKVSQQLLQDERSKHNREVMSLKLQLCRSEMQLKCQRSRSEKQMTDIMAQLVILESRLLHEQKNLKKELRNKNQTIVCQRQEIVKLKDQNEQLLNAIKEICAKGGMNGYMRENRRKNGSGTDFDNGGKSGKDKKGHNSSKLGSVKDKFLSKNRSSLELNSINLEKFLLKDDRLCSSQEDLRRITEDRRRSIPNGDTSLYVGDITSKDRPHSDSTEYSKNNNRKQTRYSQNFFSETGSPQYEINKSISESSHLSENSNSSSGVFSMSDHDLSSQDVSVTNGNHNNDYNEDEEDDRIFSFSSTHINTVIDEEDVMGPISHSGSMMSMGSMPMLANLSEEQCFQSGKHRPHSLSSVDLASIQLQAENISSPGGKYPHSPLASEMVGTPPSSPSSLQNKNEMTPFQTFKTMFRRKGSSKNKGHKKRSVSLSQTTNKEYSEALKKHFQKYDMS